MIYITVCRNAVQKNNKRVRKGLKPIHKPVRICVGRYGKPTYAWEYDHPAFKVKAAKDGKALPWGAKVWIQVKVPGRLPAVDTHVR